MLDEMRWLQADFKEERKWKIVLAKQMIDWIIEWHKLKNKSDVCIQVSSVNSHILSLKDEKYNRIDHNDSFQFFHNETESSQKLHNQNERDNEDLDFNNIGSNVKKVSPDNVVMLHSPPLFIIENAVQLLEIPLDSIIATFPNFFLASNSILPDLPVYQPPVPEDTLYHDPLDEMKIIPLSKYTQSHIRITHLDKFLKKRKRGMSPVDTENITDKQRAIINDFSLSNSQISNSKKKSSYPSQLRPPNVPLNLETRKPIWTSDEDDLLMTYLPKYQFNWEFVAQLLTPSIKWISPLEKKTAWDCFERWVQLDPHASNVIFVGPYAKMAYSKLEPLLKNTRATSYGGLFRSKKNVEKNMQNIKLKRQRQFNMFDAIRKTMKKREVFQKLNAGPSKKVAVSHDTHGLPHKPSVTAPTPLDLSRLKHERDQLQKTSLLSRSIANKFGGKYTVTLIPGDGIGKEISESVKTIFKMQKIPVEFEQIDITGSVKMGEKNELFEQTIKSLKRNKVGLKGILYTPSEQNDHFSFNVALRKVSNIKDLDIYANLTLIKNIPGVETPHKNIDFVIIRENTEGEYSGLEHQSVPGVVESLKIITRTKSERISRFAFDFALKNNRKKVTVIHKANIMKLGDGFFRNTFFKIAEDYPQIEASDLIVDNASMQAVRSPQKFDVLVMPNLYGNIMSNIGAALVGGPGVVPSANYNEEYALFEPGCRHVGLDIAGKGMANPTALILSSTMLLRYLSLDNYAEAIERAVYDVILQGNIRTPDMKGTASTTAFTNAILQRLEQISLYFIFF
ncbi:hypothetical protein PCK2_000106 [Pneumocystis canis]|nr:hypothetical protein PCK2_000106 [Pneumocystis canis]